MSIKVLLVDDHTLLRSGLRRLLSEATGIEVIGEAENGLIAVQKVQELDPDIVLMDIGMPVMNGMAATKEIKKRHPEVKVLVLTVHENEEYLLQAFQAGASGYVIKKAADTDLVNAIHTVVAGDYVIHPSVTRMMMNHFLENQGSGAEGEGKHNSLTERERDVLKLVAEGYTNREIGENLYISVKTVDTHKAHIMDKLNLHKRAELVRYAIHNGMLQLEVEQAIE